MQFHRKTLCVNIGETFSPFVFQQISVEISKPSTGIEPASSRLETVYSSIKLRWHRIGFEGDTRNRTQGSRIQTYHVATTPYPHRYI